MKTNESIIEFLSCLISLRHSKSTLLFFSLFSLRMGREKKRRIDLSLVPPKRIENGKEMKILIWISLEWTMKRGAALFVWCLVVWLLLLGGYGLLRQPMLRKKEDEQPKTTKPMKLKERANPISFNQLHFFSFHKWKRNWELMNGCFPFHFSFVSLCGLRAAAAANAPQRKRQAKREMKLIKLI